LFILLGYAKQVKTAVFRKALKIKLGTKKPAEAGFSKQKNN